MTTIVRRRWNCRMSSNLLGVAAIGIAIFAGCASEEPALPPVDTPPSAPSRRRRPNRPGRRRATLRSSSRAARSARWRCRPTDGSCSRSTRRTTGSRSSASQAAACIRWRRCRSASSRSPSRRVARARSGSSTTSPTASASSTSGSRTRPASCARCSSATSRATSCSPARAARAPSSPPRTAARTRRCDPQLTTPGVGRADVWVFDADNLGATLGGTPLTIVTLFTDTPRALAVTPDGTTVYAAGFHSGNQHHHRSTSALVPDGGAAAGGVARRRHQRRGRRRRPRSA